MAKRVEETLLPERKSGWADREPTLGIPGMGTSASHPNPFSDRSKLRVTLVETRLPRTDSLGELGAGYLLEPLMVGNPLRIAIDGLPVFVTSSVHGLKRLAQDAVQVETANSTYRLERCSDTYTTPRSLQPPAPGGTADASASCRAGDPSAPRNDATCFVPLSDLSQRRARSPAGSSGSFGSGSFGIGARVKISRIKTLDPSAERLGDLGNGHILEAMEVGRTLRMSVEAGPTLVTSPVRAIHRIGDSLIEVETANTTYRLKALEEKVS